MSRYTDTRVRIIAVMHKITCPSCTHTVTEADKEWDEITQTGYCTKCNLKKEAETVISREINKVEKMHNKKGSKFIAALVVIAFFLGSLLSLNISFHYGKLLYKASISSKSWGLVKGNILSAVVKKECDSTRLNRLYHRLSQTIYSININYTYQIEANKYENNQIEFGSQPCYLKSDAENELKKYPVNSNILVYYNPASKSESVLLRAISGKSEIITCIVSFILALYGFRSLFYFFKTMVMHNQSLKRDS